MFAYRQLLTLSTSSVVIFGSGGLAIAQEVPTISAPISLETTTQFAPSNSVLVAKTIVSEPPAITISAAPTGRKAYMHLGSLSTTAIAPAKDSAPIAGVAVAQPETVVFEQPQPDTEIPAITQTA